MTKDRISAIEERDLVSEIEQRQFTSAIDMPKEETSDTQMMSGRASGITRILKKISLKNAFIMSEIFRKYGD